MKKCFQYIAFSYKTALIRLILNRFFRRYLNWMHNKNVKDEVKRTLEHKVCIGELDRLFLILNICAKLFGGNSRGLLSSIGLIFSMYTKYVRWY